MAQVLLSFFSRKKEKDKAGMYKVRKGSAESKINRPVK